VSAPGLSTLTSGRDADVSSMARAELQHGPWVMPTDPLDAEWAAVRRTVDTREVARLEEFRRVVQASGLDAHEACTCEGAAPHSQKASTLLRFLRARNGDCGKSLAMFKEALDWRRDFGIDRKLRDWRSEWADGTSSRVRLLQKYTFIGLLGQDHEGLPAYVHRNAMSDIHGLLREIGAEGLLLYMVGLIEDQFDQAHQRMMRTGHFISNFVEVYDVGNYGLVPGYLSRCWKSAPFYKDNVPVWDKVYPERVRIIFIVRVPTMFYAVWQIFLPMLPEATKKKIRMKGFHAESWLEEMRCVLPPESIPEWLRIDTAEAIAQGHPRGGLIPEGAGKC